jgi:hypothetical protein
VQRDPFEAVTTSCPVYEFHWLVVWHLANAEICFATIALDNVAAPSKRLTEKEAAVIVSAMSNFANRDVGARHCASFEAPPRSRLSSS